MPANGQITITPGTTVTDTTPITASILNQLGSPSAQVASKSIGSDHLVRSEVVDLIGSGLAGYNFLDNPNFAENRWTLGNSATSCPLATKTYRADKWWCTPSGAAITYGRVLAGPDNNSVHSAELTGASSVTTVDFGQDLPRRLGNALRTTLVLSFYLFNDTGASITPTIVLNTPSGSADDFSAVTNLYAQSAGTAAPNQAWTQIVQAIDASSYDFSKGLQVVVRLPSGAINTTGKKVKIAQCKLEINPDGTATEFVVQREWNIDEKFAALDTTDTTEASTRAAADTAESSARAAEDTAINGRIACGWETLHLRRTSTTVVTIDASNAIVRGSSNVARVSASSLTCTISSSGAGGLDTGTVSNNNWYYIWLIYNGTTTSAIFSLSASAPTMPSGYTYKLLIGECYYTSNAIRLFVSNGKQVWHDQATLASTNSTSYVQGTSSGGVISPLAIALNINVQSLTGNAIAAAVASDSSGLGSVAMVSPLAAIPLGATYGGATCQIGLLTAGAAPYVKVGSGITNLFYVTGYTRA